MSSDMTLAQAAQRTREIYAELATIWGETSPTVAIHNLAHTDLHALSAEPTHVFKANDRWHLSLTLGTYPYAPSLFSEADLSCETCRGFRPTMPGPADPSTLAGVAP